MRRTYPRKIGPVSQHSFDANAVDDTNVTGSSKQVTTDVNRKAYTSAAMIGLAISMGASSLLTPRQSDRAIAAEPMATEPTVAATPSQPEVNSLPSISEVEPAPVVSAIPESNFIRHTVQEGQTLWSIARLYQVDALAIANLNGLSSDATLHVGQVLRVPSAEQVSQIQQPELVQNYSQGVKGEQLQEVASRANESQEHSQDASRYKLAQKRQELSVALSKLKSHSGQPTPSPEGSEIASAVSEDKSSPETKPSIALSLPDVQQLSVNSVTTSSAADFPVPSLQGKTQLGTVEPLVEPLTVSSDFSARPQLLAKQNESAAVGEQALPNSINTSGVKLPTVEKVAVRNSDNSLRGIASPIQVNVQVHRVRRGDTLAKIARAYGVSRQELARINRISDPNFIWVDQTLRIPRSSKASTEFQGGFVPLTPSEDSTSSPAVTTVTTPTVVALAEPAKDALLVPQQPVSIATAPVSGLRPIYSGIAGMSQQEFRGEVNSISGVTSVSSPAVDVAKSSAPTLPVVAITGNQIPQGIGSGQMSASPYMQSLKDEVVKLRERYRTDLAAVQVKDDAVSASRSSNERLSAVEQPATASQLRINPEFRPTGYSQSLRSEILALKGSSPEAMSQQGRETVLPKVSNSTAPQVVATAPIGSENYDPIVQPLVGQMVSPDLPPLSAADRYLPDGAASFKGYIWPAKGVLTSGYGWRWGRMHRGIDIAAPVGTPIVAAAPGVVTYAGWNSGGYGNLVEVQHPDGTLTRYAHNNRILVQVGQQVDQGQQIAEMGSTGYSTGPHCHFEVHLPGQGAVNPVAYLASR